MKALGCNLYIKYTPNTLTIFPLNQNALEKAKELIIKHKLEYHSYTENSKKDKKLVIKGLLPLDLQEIEESMKKQRITPKKLTKLKHTKANEYPISYHSSIPILYPDSYHTPNTVGFIVMYIHGFLRVFITNLLSDLQILKWRIKF